MRINAISDEGNSVSNEHNNESNEVIDKSMWLVMSVMR